MQQGRSMWVAALLLGAASQVHCTGCVDGGGGGGPPKVYAPPPKVDDSAAPTSARPVLSLTVRGSTAPTLATGWPWLLQAQVLHPAAFGANTLSGFPLAGEGAFTLELKDASGQPVAAAFERVGELLPGALVLEPSTPSLPATGTRAMASASTRSTAAST